MSRAAENRASHTVPGVLQISQKRIQKLVGPAGLARGQCLDFGKTKDYAALAQTARRLAQELEELSASFDRVGGGVVVARYAAIHQMEIPRFDVGSCARALRSNAGVLFLVAGALAHQASRERPPDHAPI